MTASVIRKNAITGISNYFETKLNETKFNNGFSKFIIAAGRIFSEK